LIAGTRVRIARPSDDLDAVVTFYRDGLGLDVLGSFEDHEGFDGVMLGRAGDQVHFEFTHHRGHVVGRAPTQDNLIALYIPDREAWQRAVDRMRSCGFEPVPSYNPFWDRLGVTFEDPDGYRVVLQNAEWNL
jgi:catechol 2,3-dioxygenase-like lactoylglutathione lyase family enzyme